MALLNAVTTAGPGQSQRFYGRIATFQATVTGTGPVSATVLIQVSNDDTNWLTLATIALSGTTSASDGFAGQATWAYVLANLTAISGTNAKVTVNWLGD